MIPLSLSWYVLYDGASHRIGIWNPKSPTSARYRVTPILVLTRVPTAHCNQSLVTSRYGAASCTSLTFARLPARVFLLPPPFSSYTFNQETEASFVTAVTLETERYAQDQSVALIHHTTEEHNYTNMNERGFPFLNGAEGASSISHRAVLRTPSSLSLSRTHPNCPCLLVGGVVVERETGAVARRLKSALFSRYVITSLIA